VNNARALLKVQEEFGSFDRYIWKFVRGKPVDNRFRTLDRIPARTPLSDRISADLGGRGFSFVGSTIVYAHMQATGMVNDHVLKCFRHGKLHDGGG
jgi:DNA-3-methyladenine glycosylase I